MFYFKTAVAFLFITFFSLIRAELILTKLNDDATHRNNLSSSKYKNQYFLAIHKDELEDKITQPIQYIGNNFFLLSLDDNQYNRLKEKLFFIQPNSKIGKDIETNENNISINLLYVATVDWFDIISELKQMNIYIDEHYKERQLIKITTTAQQLQELANKPYVIMLSKNYAIKHPLSYDSYIMNRLNKADFPPPYGQNLHGEGMNIGIWDDGMIGTNINLEKERIFNIEKDYFYNTYLNHPTQVAGAAAMNTNYNNFFKGAASKANIYSWDYADDVIEEIEEGIHQFDLCVTNHSYNFDVTQCQIYSGTYTQDASDMDKLAYQYPNVLHVVAAGNSGSTCTILDSFFTIDIGYQGMKNGITVGYLNRLEQIAEGAGRGPTEDGRLKPELVTKGYAYNASTNNDGFIGVFGSSFSAPQIAGIATLLQQKYKQTHGNLPPSSLTKAILCNTARDIYTEGLDYASGFGIPNIEKALKNLDDNSFYVDSISHQTTKSFLININEPTDILAITLCWTDPASLPLQSTVLINDLDLRLITPNSDTILPWILQPNLYKSPAVRYKDRINNIEHLTLENITPGTYKVEVVGHNIPIGNQKFSVTYHTQKNGIDITYPDGGEELNANQIVTISWNNYNVTDSLSIYYSIDGGSNWNYISIVDAKQNNFYWTIPNIITEHALIRLQGQTFSDTSEHLFKIGSNRISSTNISISVCDKTARLSWPGILASHPPVMYTIYLWEDDSWKKIDTTSSTFYTLYNLINGNNYTVSISATESNIEGNKSNAKTFSTSTVACTFADSTDIGVYYLKKPLGGRQQTSSHLGNSERFTLVVKNYGKKAISNFNLLYKIGNSTLFTEAIDRTINPNDTIHVITNNTFNLSNLGSYSVLAYTQHSLDVTNKNDSLRSAIRHVSNTPIQLPWKESFERNPTIYTENIFAIDSMSYADYYSTLNGRWRNDNVNDFALSGKRSLTLDCYKGNTNSINEHIITLNLSNYIDSTIYFDFNYLHRNETQGLDTVFARGSDTSVWVTIYDLHKNRTSYGIYKKVEEIDLYRKLKLERGQNFSSSTQIKIKTASKFANSEVIKRGGYTFDDFCLYVANNDVANTTSDSSKIVCLNKDTVPITISIVNHSRNSITNLSVSYTDELNNTITETISTTIPSLGTLTYTFTQPYLISNPGKYLITTTVNNNNDSYTLNDTAQFYIIANRYIPTLPYLNTFESEGLAIPDGTNSSWTLGEPYKYYTRGAAEDNNSWTNSSYRTYNYNENSSLYLGCYNLENVNILPTISLIQLQNIETFNDSVWAEYSTNANIWHRLGCANCGTNWYNNQDSINRWDKTLAPWQTAATKISIDTSQDNNTVFIRLRLKSDEGYAGEGFGIDNIHLYIDSLPIALGDTSSTFITSTGTGWINCYDNNNKLILSLFDNYTSLGNIKVTYTTNTDYISYLERLLLQRRWSLSSDNSILGNYKVRFYISNEEYLRFITQQPNAYSMNDIIALRYNGINIDSLLNNNHAIIEHKFYQEDSVDFIPIEDGYYVELNTDKLGEFFLLGKEKHPNFILPATIITLNAEQAIDDAIINWQVSNDNLIDTFFIEYSLDGITYTNVDTVLALHALSDTTNYSILHNSNANNGDLIYYRITYKLQDGELYQSSVDTILFSIISSIKNNTKYITAYFSGNQIIVANKNNLRGSYKTLLTTVDGRVLYHDYINYNQSTVALPISSRYLPNQIYLLHIYNDTESYYTKLVKQ